jgi:hypothetical protein
MPRLLLFMANSKEIIMFITGITKIDESGATVNTRYLRIARPF